MFHIELFLHHRVTHFNGPHVASRSYPRTMARAPADAAASSPLPTRRPGRARLDEISDSTSYRRSPPPCSARRTRRCIFANAAFAAETADNSTPGPLQPLCARAPPLPARHCDRVPPAHRVSRRAHVTRRACVHRSSLCWPPRRVAAPPQLRPLLQATRPARAARAVFGAGVGVGPLHPRAREGARARCGCRGRRRALRIGCGESRHGSGGAL